MRPGKFCIGHFTVSKHPGTVGGHQAMTVYMRPTVINTRIPQFIAEEIKVAPVAIGDLRGMYAISSIPGKLMKPNSINTVSSHKLYPLLCLIVFNKWIVAGNIYAPKFYRCTVFKYKILSFHL